MYLKKILITLVFITFCYLIIHNYSVVNEVDQKERFLQIKETIRKFASSSACKQPVLPLNASEMIKFIKEAPVIDCSSAVDWVQCTGSECMIKEEIKLQKGTIKCSFTDILRKDDFRLYYGEPLNTDSYYKLEASDFVKVKCQSSEAKWSSTLPGIRLDKSIWERTGWQYLPKNGLKLNILMFGFDSLSRNTFIRKLPKSYEYLTRNLKGLVLQGYNIVGDGTPQALTPILTGKTELELPDVRKRFSHSDFVDIYPFIWKNFSKYGYVTAYMEDSPSTGTYQYRLKGFLKPPTDHYMRPYFIATASEMSQWPKLCAGEIPRHKVMLDYVENFFSVYKSKPKFLFGFHAELSHDDYNSIGAADNELLTFLKNLEKNGVLNNTLLIMMADHGHRFTNIRNTLQGKQEERLPFFSFRFPDWFKSKHKRIYENFVSNLNTLTTPFDIYSTLSDVLNFQSPDVGNLDNRSISLFSKIPLQRSCSQASIEPHWCACLEWEPISLQSNIVKKLTDAFINTLNNYTSDHRDVCAVLQVSKVEWVTRMKANDQLMKFKKNLDHDGFVADLSGTTQISSYTYQLKVVAVPGDSLFEASITHYLKDDRFDMKLSDVSRINLYGSQARCIENTFPNLRKYCYCIVD